MSQCSPTNLQALLASRRAVRPKEMLHCGVLQSLGPSFSTGWNIGDVNFMADLGVSDTLIMPTLDWHTPGL